VKYWGKIRKIHVCREKFDSAVKLGRTHRQRKKTNRLKIKRGQPVNRKKIPSIYRKQITRLQSGNQTDMELQNRTVGLPSKSNKVIMQRSQSKILRAITNAPRYVTNLTLHTDFNITYVSDVTHVRINKRHNKPEAHPNPLLQPPLQPVNTRRLKRCWPSDLQGTWGDIAQWIPYCVIAIYGIVVYFV